MWGHDALCLYEPCCPRLGASVLPNVLPPADKPVVTYMLNPPILWGARAIPLITDGYVSINRREDNHRPNISYKACVRPFTHILPLMHTSTRHGVDAFNCLGDGICYIVGSPTATPANFHFVNFWERVISHLISYDIMYVELYDSQLTGSEKPVAVWKVWRTCHGQYVIPT